MNFIDFCCCLYEREEWGEGDKRSNYREKERKQLPQDWSISSTIKCICPNWQKYFSKLKNVFVEIDKCIFPKWNVYLSKLPGKGKKAIISGSINFLYHLSPPPPLDITYPSNMARFAELLQREYFKKNGGQVCPLKNHPSDPKTRATIFCSQSKTVRDVGEWGEGGAGRLPWVSHSFTRVGEKKTLTNTVFILPKPPRRTRWPSSHSYDGKDAMAGMFSAGVFIIASL